MEMAEKLKRLTEGKRRAEIARAAKVPPSVLGNYINRGSEAMAGAALRLSRILGVPLEWLVDDEAGWPPPTAGTPPAQLLSDSELMFEVARRHRITLLRLLDAVKAAEKINWEAIAAGNEKPPPNLKEIVVAVRFSGEYRDLYDPEVFSAYHHVDLPGGQLPMQTFSELDQRTSRLAHRNEAFGKVADSILITGSDWSDLTSALPSVQTLHPPKPPSYWMGKGKSEQ